MTNNGHRVRWNYLGLLGTLVGLDHFLKFWVCSHLKMYQFQWGWDGVFGLTRVRNYSLVNELGSRLEDPVRLSLLWGVPFILLSLLLGILVFRWNKQKQDGLDVGLAFLFFGGLSNVLPLQGTGVIETMAFQPPLGLKGIYFNLADVMIWTGLLLLALNWVRKFEWAPVVTGWSSLRTSRS